MADEMDLDEFLALPDEKARAGKVDYDAVLNEIIDRPLTVGAIGKIMKANAVDKAKVYYSEVTNWLDRLSVQGTYEVLIKWGRKKFVLVRRKAEQAEEAEEEEEAVEEVE